MTLLKDTALAAADEICAIEGICIASVIHGVLETDMVPGLKIADLLEKHFQPVLAKVEGERDAARIERDDVMCSYDQQQREFAALRADLASAKEKTDALKYWKASAMEVEAAWDCQVVGKLIGAPLGSAIRPLIQPAIERLKADLAAKEAAINQALKKLRHIKKETETGIVYWETYAFESELLAIEALASRTDRGATRENPQALKNATS